MTQRCGRSSGYARWPSSSRAAALRGLLIAAVVVLGLVLAPAALAAAPANPLLSGSTPTDPNLSAATSVAISGHYAYTTAYLAGELTAIDFSNPAHPVVAGESAPSNALLNASTVNISGGYAYVVSKNRNGPCMPGPAPNMCGTGSNDDGTGNSLTILDISTNPAVPQIVGPPLTDATKLFGAYGVAIATTGSSTYAYIAAQGCVAQQPCPNPTAGNSFEVVDVTNPLAPMIVASLANSSLPSPFTGSNALDHACSVTVSGHYAYVTAAYPSGSGKLTIIDISKPLNPTIVKALGDPTIKFPVDVAVKGNYAYVADQANNLGRVEVVDISNPAAANVVSSVTDLATLNGAYRIRVSGNFAYVSGSSVATVTAIDISDPLNPREAAHLTDPTHLNKTTGLDVDPTSQYVVASSPYLSTQSNSTYPPFSTGAATGTISVIQIDPTPIGVTITANPANPTTQTSANFTFAATDAISSVLCSLDTAPLAACTSATAEQYTGLAAGTHTFNVQATDAAGNVASDSYTWTIDQAPANTNGPAISGTATQGQILTASPGTWTGVPAPTFTYTWADCDAAGSSCSPPISGATASTYTAQASDAGFTLKVTVTGSNGVGSPSSATSRPTAQVTAPAVNTVAPSITGTATRGSTLTATHGTWTGFPAPTYAYTWADCDATGANCLAPIPGATSSTYQAQTSDAGHTLEVTVTASNGVGSPSAPVTSGPTAQVTAPPANTGTPAALPSIAGTPAPGQTLTASTGTWTGFPTPTFTYQWSDCDATGASCTTIGAATTVSTYVVQSSDLGFTLRVTVVGTNSLNSASAKSAATALVTTAPVDSMLPTISGSAAPGQTLTASPGTWTGTPPPAFTYQWSRCDATGANCTTIGTPSAVTTFVVQNSELGSTLRVIVVGTNTVGSSAATSAPTRLITTAPVNTTLPTISGTATQGQTLTASNGTWTGVPAPAFTYQWNRCNAGGAQCAVISGATGSSYSLGAGDVGHTLRVAVLATNSVGSSLASSLATAVVAPIHGPLPVTPTISSLRQAAKTWRETTKPAHAIAGQPKPKRLPTGTTFSLTLNESASVKFSFTLKTPGRKVNGRCRKQTSQNRHQKSCTIKLGAGSWVLSARRGANRFKFAGHLAHGKTLRAGSYTVTITATATGKRSRAKTLSFTIAP